MIKKVLSISILIFVLSCSKHPDFPVYDVPAELQPFINSFIREAALRGHNYTINNLIIKYDENLDLALCGQCNSRSSDPNIQKIISIAPNKHCWNNQLELETLIFHELGHCFLGRPHLNELLPNGDPKSIMVLNTLTLYSPCNYPIGGQPCDNYFKRTYYLDELFDVNTPVPEWAK